MNITMMRCKEETTTGPCSDNAEHFYEILHCQRFKKDDTGPWFMVSDGMQKTSKCGEEIVNFQDTWIFLRKFKSKLFFRDTLN